MESPPVNPRPDQLAPHSVEAEEAVLGAVLVNPDALLEVAHFLTPDHFFIVRHGWIFEVYLTLDDRGMPVDYLTVIAELEERGRLAEVGGAAYVLELLNKTPSALNAEGYGRIVERMALRRRLIEAASQIARVAHSEETDIDELAMRAEALLFEATHRKQEKGPQLASEIAAENYDRVAYLMRNPDKVIGIKTYLHDVDKILVALAPGALHVLAGRTGMGKTGAAIHILKENAKHGIPGLMFSLEMSKSSVTERIETSEAQVNTQRMASGRLTEEEWERYTGLLGNQAATTCYVDDTPAVTPAYIKRTLMRYIAQHNVQFAIVDYIQLMGIPREIRRHYNREQQISWISESLKHIARELCIPFIEVAQLSRACEQRPDKRPLLSDLRESGSIENDAWTASFLYRPEYYDKSEDPHTMEWLVRKNRNGPCGIAYLYWEGECVAFSNAFRRKVALNEQKKQAVR